MNDRDNTPEEFMRGMLLEGINMGTENRPRIMGVTQGTCDILIKGLQYCHLVNRVVVLKVENILREVVKWRLQAKRWLI